MAPVAVKAFKLLPGKQHMHNGEELKEGDQVLLNASQAVAFKDKLVPVDPSSKYKVYSESEEKKFVEAEVNRRAERDRVLGTPGQPGVESHDS